MRRFLLALTILSVLVMSQNVVAGTPIPTSPGLLGEAVEGVATSGSNLAMGTTVGGVMPEPVSLALLLTGLSGLAAAGNRKGRERAPTRI